MIVNFVPGAGGVGWPNKIDFSLSILMSAPNQARPADIDHIGKQLKSISLQHTRPRMWTSKNLYLLLICHKYYKSTLNHSVPFLHPTQSSVRSSTKLRPELNSCSVQFQYEWQQV